MRVLKYEAIRLSPLGPRPQTQRHLCFAICWTLEPTVGVLAVILLVAAIALPMRPWHDPSPARVAFFHGVPKSATRTFRCEDVRDFVTAH